MAITRKLLALVLCLFIAVSSYSMVYAQEAPVSPSPVIVEPTPTPTALEPALDGTNPNASFAVTLQDPAASIAINAPALSVRMGNTLTLSASVLPATASQSVVWSSSDTAVAAVSANGLVTPREKGNVTITAKTSDGTDLSAQVELTVLQPLVGSISLTCPTDTLTISDKWFISATVYPYDADAASLVFSSSNTNVLRVGKDGSQVYIEGVSPGQATLTVTATDGSNTSASKLITVLPVLVNYLDFYDCPSSVFVNQYRQITMSCYPTDASNKTLHYESSNPEVLKVEAGGLLLGIAPGEAVITASTTDGSNLSVSRTVSVTIPVSSIQLTCPDTVMAGTEFDCTLEVLPLNAADRSVTFEQNNYGFVYIDSATLHGTASSVGQMTVTVTANDGSGVSYSKTITVIPRLVETVMIDYCPSILRLNETAYLLASCLPYNAADPTLSYTSSNPSVVQVDNSGLLYGLALGQATITVAATDGSNASASQVVTVLPAYPDRISMNFSDLTLALSEVSTLLKATPIPSDADATFTWSSTNTSVATVDEYGSITAVGLGYAAIYAASPNGATTYCSVYVVNPGQAVTSISLNRTSASINGGKDLVLKASVLPKEATDKSVRWSSSNPDVASVSGDGTVSGFTPGVTVITATAASGLSAQCIIYVKSLSVSQVVLSKDYLELDEGKTAILKASVLPSNASFKAVTWSSSDPAVAVVSKNGKITATGQGTAVIIASAHNGINASCTVTVP